MPTRSLKPLYLAFFTWLGLFSAPALACTISTSPPVTELGTHSSFAIAGGNISSSSTATGIRCVTLLEVVSNSYLALKFEGSIPPLKNTANTDTIPLTISWTAGGPALSAELMHDEHSTTILGLLKASGGYITLHYRTQAATSIRAGVYESTLRMRWYYSMCLVGVGSLCVPENSTGLKRSGCLLGICLGALTDWGSGELVTVKLRMVVERDCTISAPTVNFGTRPLPDTFDTISQSATVRCSIGDAYAVALDDGKNASGTTRRMSNGTSFLEYDIFKGTSGTNRWGSTPTERRSSTSADVAPNVHDGVATQSYHYRAQIRPAQAPVPAGAYKDTLRLSIIF